MLTGGVTYSVSRLVVGKGIGAALVLQMRASGLQVWIYAVQSDLVSIRGIGVTMLRFRFLRTVNKIWLGDFKVTSKVRL